MCRERAEYYTLRAAELTDPDDTSPQAQEWREKAAAILERRAAAEPAVAQDG
ncbi:hypothetical protein SAMN04489730_0131 [Amycolatopsis australiensis]|uniref:Uncharacterized protein n=2 Tax=Amycolatopsis australiensis TaxID=546364 RepID=A0A1K1LQ89_9PSEU|nr:hypothetical protein SAMN04489730_0131 [Amycolatopsis australiensis]